MPAIEQCVDHGRSVSESWAPVEQAIAKMLRVTTIRNFIASIAA
jgi:hypothetical protein